MSSKYLHFSIPTVRAFHFHLFQDYCHSLMHLGQSVSLLPCMFHLTVSKLVTSVLCALRYSYKQN